MNSLVMLNLPEDSLKSLCLVLFSRFVNHVVQSNVSGFLRPMRRGLVSVAKWTEGRLIERYSDVLLAL